MLELGRVLAYYPNLKKLTGSTTSSILLCQLLYWSDRVKNEDGWIYKTTDEIEEETGLTYNEQKTAKTVLLDLGVLEQERKRMAHTTRYRINRDMMDKKWEEINPSLTSVENTPEKMELIEEPVAPVTTASFVRTTPEKKAEKKGDWLDAILDHNVNSPGAIREKRINEIRGKIESELHLNTDTGRWEKFLEFLYTREKNHNEPVEKFLEWALANGYDPIYWSPDRMKTLHPQAYWKSAERPKDFIKPLPKRVEKDIVPMPDYVAKKKPLY